ncbi:PucR family transcriptional regulator [Prauserella marina]|uniref:DNA-binding transcriptional regulator, PucR family n=1 Tax=Prauserella marina TaxID=530584 RepID=A0A222VLL9_9PSEU|nr:helix-turn-helix domain-containing protein [Prauserella marina]ASR34816.1 PucR family transcriptional regulator [Prauserella marina]PWV85490.1 DNA-binding PucR family transcriptional regulator [Prauserella marina]SDC53582.1 DNA-binding transcriptional regulator, PucR family [Prauserella marina]
MASQASPKRHGLSAKTLRELERASGRLAKASVTAMEEQLSWFGRLPADQRASVLMITQTGAAGFVSWLQDSQEALKLTTEAFRTAPRELSRWISLRQTVGLVRLAIEVFEEQLPEFAADESERAALTEGILRYGREVAFAAANSYAAAAEARGAWDARLEALVVDGIVRGDAEESVASRAAALGWDPAAPATVLVGNPPSDDPPTVVFEVRSRAARAGRPVLLSVQGSRLVVVVAGPTDGTGKERTILSTLSTAFAEGPVVAGPTMPDLAGAHHSAVEALSGLRAVVGWPAAPRPTRSADLLPERALAGDAEAERQLIDEIARPLEEAGPALLQTIETYLESGGVLEACAKLLFVHPNTVRYRLRKAAELTGRNASDPRDALVLRIALTVGRLARSRGLW